MTPELTKEDFDGYFSGIFGLAEDFHEGESQYLIGLLKSAGINPTLYENFCSVLAYNMTGRQKTLWAIAAKEEQDLGEFDVSKISDFATAIPKIPRSWVKQITALDDTKTIRYMFSGSFVHLNKHRTWLPEWVKEHFGPEDYFRATDARKGKKKYKPMGVFDQSLNGAAGFRPKGTCHDCLKFDETYWAKMRKSKFIICPGGDAPYSFRFYESYLAGSIPIIHNYEDDWKDRQNTRWISAIKYEHKMTDEPHVFDAAVAKLNLKKFIRYQTWLEGDHDPAKDQTAGFKFE